MENQKNQLTDEFNKMILQININNQTLENKQSQLRASLIQNYETIDQKEFIEEKLDKLKIDLNKFILQHKDYPDTKASQIALDFRDFYEKYFTNSIDDELNEYRFYSQKLKEQKEKEALMGNMDLIMRNKGEEKLVTEKRKVETLRSDKEKIFHRLNNENTTLISECNRLRKNLHEIYVHVIDIEQRFEQLTNIDPNLSKSEIVRQIKEFIKLTHEKIKENYAVSKKKVMMRNINPVNKFQNKRYYTPVNKVQIRKNKSTNDIQTDLKNVENNKEINNISELKETKNYTNKNNEIEKEKDSSQYYRNIIVKPKIVKRSDSLVLQKNQYNNINSKFSMSVKRGKVLLPSISIKK